MDFSEWIIVAAVTLIFISAFISFGVFGRKRRAVSDAMNMLIPRELPAEGVRTPLIASYSGPKALAPVTFSHNNMFPQMTLFEDQFDYKVILKRSAYYSDVESLRAYKSRFYNRLIFKFFNTNLFFIAVLPNEELLDKILAFLAEKGIFPDEGSRL